MQTRNLQSTVVAFRLSCAEMPLFLFAVVLLSGAAELWADEICCPGLRCYNNSPPFGIFPLPQCPGDMGMNMQVYTRQNPKIGQNITRDITPSNLKSYVKTILVIHGWSQNERFPWLHDLKDAFLEQGDCNVVIVGWSKGAEHYLYPQSASNTRTVGGEVALIFNNLIKKGILSRDDCYCVGHSLGAHACGHAGQQGQFGRITGLDPAGPLFEGRDLSIGLNPSCADFVDVIHTNGRYGLGMLTAVGHVDFYPNGGTIQPGCTNDTATELVKWTDYFTWDTDQQDASLQLIVACSHMRAYELFTESVRKPDFVSRFHCPSTLLLSIFCPKDAIQSMGFKANTNAARGIFYLKTNSTAPFSLG